MSGGGDKDIAKSCFVYTVRIGEILGTLGAVPIGQISCSYAVWLGGGTGDGDMSMAGAYRFLI